MRILVFTKIELSLIIKNAFAFNKDYESIIFVSSIEKLNEQLSYSEKLILLTDLENTLELEIILKTITDKKMKTLFFCKSVKNGFIALQRGATDMIIEPNYTDLKSKTTFTTNILVKVARIAKTYDVASRVLKNNFDKQINKIIVIGASTGGTEVILQILKEFPKDSPPILIVQHMPPVFTTMYSKRLHDSCKISVWEAKHGDVLETGLAFIAPGEMQMRLNIKNNKYIVECTKEAPFGGHIPSVDVLFNSVADIAGNKSIGIILTGMGDDGAKGLLNMRKKGSYTLGQNEESCIVYGMPKIAYEIGAVQKQADPKEITKFILEKI
ncbi:MAG: CheB methylesterase domain-containing protein [Defluviitaleaceae bacterium]|nr:CheB methylesterase domain-containing protein [Defluviitaleaceae bacterium]